MDFDFGLTGLAGNYFHADWAHDGSRFDVLRLAFGADRERWAVESARRDAQLMRDGLSSDAVGTLWGAGNAWFGIPDGPGAAHQWLDEIIAFCDGWLARHAGPSPAYVPVDGLECAVEVLSLVAEVSALPAEVAAALSDCVRRCTPDLGLRWFMQAVQGLREPALTPEQYRRLIELAERFGYGEFVVPAREILVADG